jgi:hypothetical protein
MSNSEYYIIMGNITSGNMEFPRTVEAVDPEQHILSMTGYNSLHTPA